MHSDVQLHKNNSTIYAILLMTSFLFFPINKSIQFYANSFYTNIDMGWDHKVGARHETVALMRHVAT